MSSQMVTVLYCMFIILVKDNVLCTFLMRVYNIGINKSEQTRKTETIWTIILKSGYTGELQTIREASLIHKLTQTICLLAYRYNVKLMKLNDEKKYVNPGVHPPRAGY